MDIDHTLGWQLQKVFPHDLRAGYRDNQIYIPLLEALQECIVVYVLRRVLRDMHTAGALH